MGKTSAAAIENALGLWRDGWNQARNPALPVAWRGEYLLAINATTVVLETRTTMDELVAWYYRTPAELERVLDAVTCPASGHILNVGIVEDAAFWYRARQLIEAQGGTDATGA